MPWFDLNEKGSGADYSFVFRPVRRHAVIERIAQISPGLSPTVGPSDPSFLRFAYQGLDYLYFAEDDCEHEITFFCSLPDPIVSRSITSLYDTVVRPNAVPSVWLMPGVARAMAIA